jgi:hypothetical protein
MILKLTDYDKCSTYWTFFDTVNFLMNIFPHEHLYTYTNKNQLNDKKEQAG